MAARGLSFAVRLLCCCLVASGLPAMAAAAPSAEERAVALKYYELAVQSQEQQRWRECEGYIEQALAAAETPQLRFHLAYCLEMQQRWVEALLNYKQVEQAARQSGDAAELEAYLGPALSSLEERMPSLKLVLERPVAGVSLFIDGKQRSSTLLGAPIPFDPGPRTVELVADGYRPYRLKMTFVPRDRRTLVVSMIPERAPPARGARPSRSPARSAKAATLAVEAAVVASGVVLGAVFNWEQQRAERALGDYRREFGEPICGDPPPAGACRMWSELQDTATQLKTAKYVSLVSASVGAAALLTTWWLWPDNAPERAAFTVAPSPDGVSAWVTRSF